MRISSQILWWWWSSLLSSLQEQRRNRMRDLPAAVPRDKVLLTWVTISLLDEQISSCFLLSENIWSSCIRWKPPEAPVSLLSILSRLMFFSSCSKAPVGRLCPTLILLPLTARSLRCVPVWLHVSDLCPHSGCCISLKSLWQQSAWRASFFPLMSYLTFSPTLYCKSAFI